MYQRSLGKCVSGAFSNMTIGGPPPLSASLENCTESALSLLAKGKPYRSLWILNELGVKLNCECCLTKWVES